MIRRPLNGRGREEGLAPAIERWRRHRATAIGADKSVEHPNVTGCIRLVTTPVRLELSMGKTTRATCALEEAIACQHKVSLRIGSISRVIVEGMNRGYVTRGVHSKDSSL